MRGTVLVQKRWREYRRAESMGADPDGHQRQDHGHADGNVEDTIRRLNGVGVDQDGQACVEEDAEAQGNVVQYPSEVEDPAPIERTRFASGEVFFLE